MDSSATRRPFRRSSGGHSQFHVALDHRLLLQPVPVQRLDPQPDPVHRELSHVMPVHRLLVHRTPAQSLPVQSAVVHRLLDHPSPVHRLLFHTPPTMPSRWSAPRPWWRS